MRIAVAAPQSLVTSVVARVWGSNYLPDGVGPQRRAAPCQAASVPGVSTWLVLGDLAGIFVFAVSGALLGVRRQLDLVGVLFLAVVTSLGGGMMRDVLIGAVPPATLSDWRYLLVPVVAGLVTLRFHPAITRLERTVAVLDALGLGLFCVTGTSKALLYGVGPVPAALLGMLTGIGGGVLRDLLASRTPLVLRQEVYALPALAGAAVVAVGTTIVGPSAIVAAAGASACIGLRLLAIRYRWQMPRAGGLWD